MKFIKIKLYAISAFTFFVGIIIAKLVTEVYVPELKESHLNEFSFHEIFFTILIRNIGVSLMISIIGFLTGGFCSIVVIFWNGFMLGKLLNVPNDFFWDLSRYIIFHGVFELHAFFLFGVIGLKGFWFYLFLFRNNEINIIYIPNFFDFTIPLALLCFSAFLETIFIELV